MTGDPRRHLPGVDRLLAEPWCAALQEAHGRPLVTRVVRAALADLREGSLPIPDDADGYRELVSDRISSLRRPGMSRAINATGVVLHTNLGRAPLPEAARRAMAAAAGYGNLEFDLASGKRGSRYDHCVPLIRELTGAEDALVVNNCAAAVALALASHGQGAAVAVSHGELVEIGGGFRIPEVVESAGARLVAVGTTNRTRLDDYARAVEEGGATVLLKVHRSNFQVTGFTEAPTLAELVELGRELDVPVIYDLGSGLMVDPGGLGLPPEPGPAESVKTGADLVLWSGDKLLGGPQAGLMAGRAAAVSRARRHPLCRAVRCDKVTLAGLEATLDLYRDPARALRDVPVLAMLARDPLDLQVRADALVTKLPAGRAQVVRGTSVVGGGTFPGVEIPTCVIRLDPPAGV
ncbi:MAG: L-seryl-tRNA(Sec) selenium transferase, partial [Gemmatimonadetes bacterium]|nr:L-seryl-tRNA(Sec) selenium transferase [Gemmatimonadota bacterium]